MNMKKYKYLVYIISILTCFSSCDYLDLEPEDMVTRDKFFRTKEEVASAVMGCYAAMMDQRAMQNYFAWGENRAETNANATRSNSTWSSIKNGELSPTQSTANWASIYAVINNCNSVLEYAKRAQEVDRSFSYELLKEYEAEAICVRSLMYFYLVRAFGDVPYITTASINDDQNYMVPKTPQAEILDSLVSSLKRVDKSQNGTFPQVGIPFNYGTNSAVNKGRFTVWSLKALLADIYLWKEDYRNCLIETTAIINSGQYSLLPISSQRVDAEDAMGQLHPVYYPSEGDVDAYFNSMYVAGNSVESILELQFAEDYENPFYGMFSSESGYIVPNTEYFSEELFVPSNIDRGWYDIRTEGVSAKQGLVWKWIGLDRSAYTYRQRSESFSNWIFYRLSDIKLMKAEALNQLGKETNNMAQLTEALEIVREIRTRACAPESTDLFTEGTPMDAALLEEFILQERGRELVFEGKRWFDVLRNAKRNNYAGIGYLLKLAVYAATPDKAIGLQNKWKGDYNSHYFPIYENELKSNSALVQNSFYLK